MAAVQHNIFRAPQVPIVVVGNTGSEFRGVYTKRGTRYLSSGSQSRDRE